MVSLSLYIQFRKKYIYKDVHFSLYEMKKNLKPSEYLKTQGMGFICYDLAIKQKIYIEEQRLCKPYFLQRNKKIKP